MVNSTSIKTSPGWTTISIDSPDAIEEMAKAFKARTPRIMVTGGAKGSRNRDVAKACGIARAFQLALQPGIVASQFVELVSGYNKAYAELLVLEDFEDWENLTLRVVAGWAIEYSLPIAITLDLEDERYADSDYLAKQLSRLGA